MGDGAEGGWGAVAPHLFQQMQCEAQNGGFWHPLSPLQF